MFCRFSCAKTAATHRPPPLWGFFTGCVPDAETVPTVWVVASGLRIQPSDFEKLAHRVTKDARVLAEWDIIDHSLLLVRVVSPAAPHGTSSLRGLLGRL
jgi:hypothetical protein